MRPTFACVKHGTKYSDDYVLHLRNSIARRYRGPHDFICLTDRPVEGVTCEPLGGILPGWWAKLELFRLKRPLIYFDLDVVITGDVTPLAEWQGFGIIEDWWRPTFNSSVMVLTGDEYDVWEKFQPRFMQMVEGDQDYITGVMAGRERIFPREWFPSYKASNLFEHPPGPEAIAAIFHGFPKPHQVGGWVKDYWL